MPVPFRSRFLICAFAGLSCVTAAAPNNDESSSMLGYNNANATHEAALEQKFDAMLDAKNLRDWLKQMSSAPNHLGSPHDKQNAEFVLKQFQSWGFDAHIETFDVLFPTPKVRLLELTAPTQFKAGLEEPAIPEDSTSKLRERMLPTYNAYSADGDVTGELVYVNYGVPDDYKELELRGISVKGKIVIARYGQSWRGIKPKVAQEHGAIGCIIYSDPHDDGYFQGDTYPQGAFRGEYGVQRGSVADMPLYAGDPLTPGVGATKNAKRLSRDKAPSLLKIPVLPISYADAQPLLKALTGPVAPEKWRGALPFTYHIGPGAARVHLKLAFNWDITPAYDVVAMIRGSTKPDEWVLRGNHRDGWVFGAADPLSGQVAMLEEARVLGEMLKTGWRPKRSIVYLSWDGEEPGLLGSTEWAETHADELRRKAVLYINSDGNGRGFLEVGGSHALEHLMNEITERVSDPQTGVSVLARKRAQLSLAGQKPDADPQHAQLAKAALALDRDLPIDALGSGSDYSPFLQHLGIPALNIAFGGEDNGGDYHSIYDSFDHYARFADPKFEYGVTLAKVTGHTVLRVAGADVLPLRFTNLSDTIHQYADELHKLNDQMREKAQSINQLRSNHAYTLSADPTETFVVPPAEPNIPYLNFAPLDNALVKLKESTNKYDTALAAFFRLNASIDDKKLSKINGYLNDLEQTLTRKEGLPGRSWYQHLIYAPGVYTGYGVKTLPAIREAMEQKRMDEAERFIGITATALNAYANKLDQATALLQP